MSAEPQRDIEHDLRAYKQRRDGQLGAPVELHPATRKMLQGEVARAASRPLLTSEEAAKNFVRSFVMSHQQPGFFARYKPQLLWGGGMFACLAVVLLVLRNDPQQTAREKMFSDALPAPLAAPTPSAATKRDNFAVASKPQVEAEQLSRLKRAMPVEDSVQQEVRKFSAAPAGGPAPAVTSPRGSIVAFSPAPGVRRESEDRRSGAPNAPLPTAPTMTANETAVRAAVSPAGRGVAPTEAPLDRLLARDADRKLMEKVEKAEAGAGAQPVKALKATESAALKKDLADKDGDGAELKLKLSDEMKRAQTQTLARSPMAGAAGGGGRASGSPAPMPPAAPAAVAPSAPAATAALAYGAASAGEAGQARQRFQQLDNLSVYRRNFNSPPLPQVMQDFAFERTGDRVRIVDADGSTYDGTVLPDRPEVLTAELREKQTAALDAAKERKAVLEEAVKPQRADAAAAYRFHVSGVNRKLNQNVEFRGEWQPATPAPAPAGLPALQATSLGVQFENKIADQKKAPVTNALANNPAPTQTYLFLRQQKESSQGRISGRAVVGGKNEFDINAVPK